MPAPKSPHRFLEDAERFIEEVRGDAPDLATFLRGDERKLEARGPNWKGKRGSVGGRVRTARLIASERA